MKKLITIITLTASATCYGQISVSEQTKTVKVGKCMSGMALTAEMKYEYAKDTTFYITFINQKYPSLNQYSTVSFKGNQAVADQLFGLTMTVFDDANKKNADYKQTIKLGETPVIIGNYRSMGVTCCQLSTVDAFVNLTESQVKKLFGKK